MIKITKLGRDIAEAPRITVATSMPGGGFEGIEKIGLWYFGEVAMSPPVLFEHLAGTALVRFFDRAEMTIDDQPMVIDDLRYVHGRSEVMKGQARVSAVLLARPTFQAPQGPIPEPQWLSYLPQIYKQFLALRKTP